MTDKLIEQSNEQIKYRADWLLDAVADATQNRQFLRGEPGYDEVAGDAIYLNGEKAMQHVVAPLQARILADTEALKAADELAILALNTGCSTQEDADRLRDKVAAYKEKRGQE